MVATNLQLLLLILCSPIFVCVGSNPQQGCPDKCACEKFDDYEVQCPKLDYRIKIDYRGYDPIQKRREYAQMQCVNSHQDVYTYMPKLNLGEIGTFKMQSCPLPTAGHSLLTVLEKLNVTKVRFLAYQALGHQENSLFRRQHFSGFKDMYRLLVSDNSKSELPEDMFEELESLNWLQLKSPRDHLPVRIFSKLVNLQALELAMKLKVIQPGQFANLHKLKTISLWGNELRNLTKETFKDVPNLVELDLSANNIVSLDAEVFSHLVELNALNINANNFSSLPSQLFANNRKLVEVKIIDNRQKITTLPAGLLANLNSLKTVHIRAGIDELPADLLSGSQNVTSLKLDGNNLKTLAPNFLYDQIVLDELLLQQNQLEHLHDDLLKNTRQLRVLRLSNNALVNISDTLFENLEELKELYLDHNNIHTIMNRAFFGTRSLERLELQYNSLSLRTESFLAAQYAIESPSTSFNRLGKLRVLLLQHNKVESILEDWTLNNLDLEELDLSFNEIKYIGIANIQFIQPKIFVNLTHNQITTIDFKDMNPFEVRESRPRISIGNNPINCNCLLLPLVQYVNKTNGPRLVDLDVEELRCNAPEPLKSKLVAEVSPYQLYCPLDDGNAAKNLCPVGCECSVRLIDYTIVMNCSSANLTAVPALPEPAALKLRSIELDISNNFIMTLPTTQDPGYNNVTVLNAEGNKLAKLGEDQIPQQIRVLQLKDNLLESLNGSVLERLNRTATLRRMSLSANEWICDCSTKNFLAFVQERFREIGDLALLRCVGGAELAKLGPGNFCPEDKLLLYLVGVISFLLIVLICVGFTVYMRYNEEIKVWLFAKGWCMWLINEDDLDEDKKYDAFVSFAHQDEEIVHHLIDELERQGEFPYKLCIHHRDWVVGDMIGDQVRRSVQESRKTIVILSTNFVVSNWGKAEFREAHQVALKEGRQRVILILYGDLGDHSTLPDELQAYMKTNTYLEWGDQWFWRKLRYALRHSISQRNSAKGRGLIKNAIKTSVDDKLELIIPSPVTPTLTTPPAEHANTIICKIPNGNGHVANGKMHNGINGHVNGAFIINTNAKQSDV